MGLDIWKMVQTSEAFRSAFSGIRVGTKELAVVSLASTTFSTTLCILSQNSVWVMGTIIGNSVIRNVSNTAANPGSDAVYVYINFT